MVASFGAVQLQARVARKSELERDRRAASADLLAHSALLVHLASAMHHTMRIRSGLKEGLDVTLRQRKPVDPLELHEQMRTEFEPIYRALATIWTLETQDVIDAANRLSNAAGEVVAAATVRGEAGSKPGRFVQGERWTDEQLDAWRAQIRTLADARREFNRLARARLGQGVVEVFLTDEE
jgi:hypothetical protein